ncbi:MAG: hypothetical protein OES47_02790 [Acidobacteriota bacterium]|nr:hypothetical protein [Acidobacteriota bacterium]
MFIGHFAIAFGAKRWIASVSLGTLFLACQLADLLWPNLVLMGLEVVEVDAGATAVTPLDFVSYPYSHSLVALGLWAAVFAGVYLLLRQSALSTAAVLGGVVLSHWLLDVVSHRPDIPVTLFGPMRLGLGMWHSVPLTIAVEGVLFALGVVVYARATRARNRIGSIALWALVGFLVVVYFGNLLGPLPPNSAAVVWPAQAMWLLVAWGYWIDRHRKPRR